MVLLSFANAGSGANLLLDLMNRCHSNRILAGIIVHVNKEDESETTKMYDGILLICQ